jgi:hypothetical protein
MNSGVPDYGISMLEEACLAHSALSRAVLCFTETIISVALDPPLLLGTVLSAPRL